MATTAKICFLIVFVTIVYCHSYYDTIASSQHTYAALDYERDISFFGNHNGFKNQDANRNPSFDNAAQINPNMKAIEHPTSYVSVFDLNKNRIISRKKIKFDYKAKKHFVTATVIQSQKKI